MDSNSITTSVVFIEYEGDILRLTNQVTSSYPTGPMGTSIKEYQYVYECALDYAQAIMHLLEHKMARDRTFKITVEYGRVPK